MGDITREKAKARKLAHTGFLNGLNVLPGINILLFFPLSGVAVLCTYNRPTYEKDSHPPKSIPPPFSPLICTVWPDNDYLDVILSKYALHRSLPPLSDNSLFECLGVGTAS